MSAELWGVLAMVGSALTVNILLTMCSFMGERGWSDSSILSVSCILGLALLLVWLLVSRPDPPSAGDVKWIICVGFFGASSSILMFLSVHVGIPLGDFAAMNSTNTVFAAFLGRLFLGEALRWPHYAAVAMSVCGGLLVSQPEALFGPVPGQAASESSPGIGYVLALLSGFCDACMYVSSRKGEHVPHVFILISMIGQLSLAMVAWGLMMGALDPEPFVASPPEASCWLAGVLIVGGIGFLLFVEAAQKCPAAVSATVDTATRITSGYGAQLLLFGAALTKETLLGAGLMLASVVLMALVRGAPDGQAMERYFVALDPDVRGVLEGGGESVVVEVDQTSEVDTDSLVSFAASEFAGTPARRLALRLRRIGGASEQPPAQVVGASLASLPGMPGLTAASA